MGNLVYPEVKTQGKSTLLVNFIPLLIYIKMHSLAQLLTLKKGIPTWQQAVI